MVDGDGGERIFLQSVLWERVGLLAVKLTNSVEAS